MKIKITVGDLTVEGELDDTATGRKVAEVLPIRTSFSTWGDEIYFTIPVDSGLDETAREEVNLGDLGYWPTGKAFCIFFGPTPMSRLGRIVPASAVNVFGRVFGDATRFKTVMDAGDILVEAAE